MGSLFRSEEMALYQLILHTDTSYECVLKLGEIGVLEFRDLNCNLSSFQRKFIDEIRRCDEMERKLRYFNMEIQMDGIAVTDGRNCRENAAKRTPQKYEMNEMELQIDKLDMELRTINANVKELKCNYLKLTELKHILRKIHEVNDKFDDDDDENDDSDSDPIETNENDSKPAVFGLCAGVISNDRLPSFERMLYRTLHGHNLYYHQTLHIHPMEDYETGKIVNKSVFIAFCHGVEIQMRIKKICTGFHTMLQPFPAGRDDRQKMAINLMKRIIDLNVVLQRTQNYRHRVLAAAAESLAEWSIKVCTIKAIYHTINKFNADTMKNCLIAECWIPSRSIDEVQSVLQHSVAAPKQSQPNMWPIFNRIRTFNEPPPTYFITNTFTNAFQMLVEKYGVADYREMNPAPYTIVTIPFLFAVMFGDFGYGMIMTLFALWMVLWGKSAGAPKNAADNEVSMRVARAEYRMKKMWSI